MLREAGGNCSAWRHQGVQGINPPHLWLCVGNTHGEVDVQVQMRLLDFSLQQGDVMALVSSLQLYSHLDGLMETTEMDPQHRCVGVVDHSWGRDHITPGKEKC